MLHIHPNIPNTLSIGEHFTKLTFIDLDNGRSTLNTKSLYNFELFMTSIKTIVQISNLESRKCWIKTKNCQFVSVECNQ